MKELQQRATRIVLAGAITLAAGAFHGCQGNGAADVQPITPGIELNKPRAPIGSPIEVKYRFELGPDLQSPPHDYTVFVHFLDSHDELLFTDDHEPPEPTSTWQAGSTVEYSRTVFVPLYPYLGTATIALGLYEPETGERVEMTGTDTGQRAYRVGELTLLDQKENIFLVYKEGWHPLESSQENPALEWQWTKQEAVCSFKNPKVDSLLYLEADSNVQAFAEPLEVKLFVGDAELTQITVEDRYPFLIKIPIPAAALGSEDWVDLRIENNQSFVPSEIGLGGDPRQLGLRVYHLYIDPQPGT
jgi:hypothetical protein